MIERLSRAARFARLLREWAAALDIPSGTFVKDDLNAAALEIERLQARIAELKKALAEEHEECAKAALSARFGPPSMWGAESPAGWHLDRKCEPWEASMHDNGCVDAFRAIRARTALRTSEEA